MQKSSPSSNHHKQDCTCIENAIGISVVIPTCDRPDRLTRALESVHKQGYQPLEILIVDNGNTPTVLQELPQNHTIIRTAPRIGVSRARNIGAQRATGEFIAFLDDDDTWTDDYLLQICKIIDLSVTKPSCILTRRVNSKDGVLFSRSILREQADFMPAMLYRNPGIGGSSTVVNREHFLTIGGFDETLVTSEDRAVIIDFLMNDFPVLCAPEAIAIINHHSEPRLTDIHHMLKGKEIFHRKYNHLMGWHEKLQYLSSMLSLRARNYRILRAPATLASIIASQVSKILPKNTWKRQLSSPCNK